MMTAAQAARYLGVTNDAVYKAARQGRLPFTIIDVQQRRYRREDLDRFTESIPPPEKRKGRRGLTTS